MNNYTAPPFELPPNATFSFPSDTSNAFQAAVAVYVLVGSAAVMVWDTLNNLDAEYLLLFKHRISLPTVVYFVSRFGTLGYALFNAIFATAPIADCARFERTIAALYLVAVPATALLFFFRIRAVFNQNKYIVAFFALLWLAMLAGCIAVTQGVTSSNISSTDNCNVTGTEGYIAAAAIIPLTNDTLVFLAISFRLLGNTHWEYTLKNGIRTLVFGDYLPSFSRAFLRDGQAYYLATVTANVLTVIMLYIPAIPVAYRTMFTVPNIMTMNIMACRIFRKTKFGLLKQDSISTGIRFRDESTSASVIPLSFTGNAAPKVEHNSAIDDGNPNVIEIIKTVEHSSDEGMAR